MLREVNLIAPAQSSGPAAVIISDGRLIEYAGAAAESPADTAAGLRLREIWLHRVSSSSMRGAAAVSGITYGRGDGLAGDLCTVVSAFGLSVSLVRSPLDSIWSPL